MKHLIRVFLFNFFALWLVKEVFPGLQIEGGIQMMLIAGGVLSLLMLIVKPMLKILFIPFNFLTFGIAGIFINVVVMYILTFLMPEVTVHAYQFPGWSYMGFMVPSVSLSYIWSLIIVSFSVTMISHTLQGLAE